MQRKAHMMSTMHFVTSMTEIKAHILASFLTHIGTTSLKGQFEVP